MTERPSLPTRDPDEPDPTPADPSTEFVVVRRRTVEELVEWIDDSIGDEDTTTLSTSDYSHLSSVVRDGYEALVSPAAAVERFRLVRTGAGETTSIVDTYAADLDSVGIVVATCQYHREAVAILAVLRANPAGYDRELDSGPDLLLDVEEPF